MIRIACTNCKSLLTVDDAFAGGVCRCQHCGTIQTVPSHLKGSAEAHAAQTAGAGGKSLYQQQPRSNDAGSGLDVLADAIASSGLADARLQKKSPAGTPAPATASGNKMLPVLVIAGAIIAVLLIAVLFLVFRGGGESANTAPNGSTQLPTPAPSPNNPVVPDGDASPPTPAPAATPNFCGIPLQQDTIVYLVDNGSSSSAVLDFVKGAVYNSIKSLDSDRKFQVLFWNPDSDIYPQTTPALALPDNLEACKHKIDDVPALGRTDPVKSFHRAILSNPGEIVLVTSKAIDLEDDLYDAIMKARGTSTVKIDAVALDDAPVNGVLERLAKATGGQFLKLSSSQLKTFAY